MKTVYCIVATYNGLKWVDKSFKSLLASEYPVSIIAVDDASDDGTPERIKKKFPEVKVIQQPVNSGTRAANNLGVKKALKNGADFVFIMNNDVWIEKDTITKLIEVATNNPGYGIISPMHLNGSNTGLDYLFSTYIEPRKCPKLYSDIYTNNLKEVYSIKNVNAAAWLVRTNVFKEVGLFDDHFRMYGEDDNFVDRVKFYGYKIGICPNARIYHDREQRTKKLVDIRTDIKKQHKRLKVISMNPNDSILDKLVLLLQKQMSDFLINLKSGKILLAIQNIGVLLYGIFYPMRFRNRHKQLKKEITDFLNASR